MKPIPSATYEVFRAFPQLWWPAHQDSTLQSQCAICYCVRNNCITKVGKLGAGVLNHQHMQVPPCGIGWDARASVLFTMTATDLSASCARLAGAAPYHTCSGLSGRHSWKGSYYKGKGVTCETWPRRPSCSSARVQLLGVLK